MANDESRGEGAPPPPIQNNQLPTRVLITAVIAAIGIIFIAQNRKRVEVNFLIFDRFVRVWVVIVVSMVLGALLLESLQWGRRRRKSRER